MSAHQAKDTSLEISFVGAELGFACGMLHDERRWHASVSFASTQIHMLLLWSTVSKMKEAA